MYAAPSVFCRKENIIQRELKRIKRTRAWKWLITARRESKRDRKNEKDRAVAAPVSYLYSSPVFPGRNSVSRTINRLLSQCLSQNTLLFASVQLTVMESFGLMDASGMGFYLLLPLCLCLHPLIVEMSVCTFSIAYKHVDWGYDHCKCTIWHSESEVQRARGNQGEVRNHLPYITSCGISTVNEKLALCAVDKYILHMCENKIFNCCGW